MYSGAIEDVKESVWMDGYGFRVRQYEKCMYQIARINFRFIVNVADDTFSSIKFDQCVYHFRSLACLLGSVFVVNAIAHTDSLSRAMKHADVYLYFIARNLI